MSTSKYTNVCHLCNKKYVRKTDCEKHKLLCAMLSQNKRSQKINAEECADTLTHSQLCTIVKDLAFKYNQLEEKLAAMQKWSDKQKKKLNVVEWLNSHSSPNFPFHSLKESLSSQIRVSIIDKLIDTNLHETMMHVFENNDILSNNPPIQCFEQKPYSFYIYTLAEAGGAGEWVLMAKEDLLRLLHWVHSFILREMVVWKKKNDSSISSNDRMSTLFNKTMIKIVEVDFTNDHTLCKIKQALFHYLKKDLKQVIEYDFE